MDVGYTGGTIINDGTLEASNGGTLLINSAVTNSGSGNALIEGGIFDFAASTNVDQITFNNGVSGTDYGELILGAPSGYSATINGFAGTAPNLTSSDGIDLAATWTQESQTISGGNLIEMLTNGSATVTLTFDDFSGSLNFAYSGGNTLITDPPPTPAVNPVVSIGGPGGTEMYDPSATNTANSPAVASTATASDDCGTVTVAGAGPADALSTTVVPQGSNDPGSLSAGAVAESNSNASVTWRFSLGNDQIDFAPGQTVTQSCEVTASDPQNPAETVTETTSVSMRLRERPIHLQTRRWRRHHRQLQPTRRH